MLAAAAALVRPGGLLAYSVCTLTAEEGPEVAATLGWPVEPPPDEPWRPWGSGALLLPQVAGTDGMFLARWRRPADS
jgi:16S rRNA (cytosine967-C5)-methyltransferase